MAAQAVRALDKANTFVASLCWHGKRGTEDGEQKVESLGKKECKVRALFVTLGFKF